jgi:hypothetical protein
MQNSHAALEDHAKIFEFKLVSVLAQVMVRGRTANLDFQP